MFNSENNSAARWEQSVPAELLEHIRDLRTQFSEYFNQVANDTIHASAVSFHYPCDLTQAKCVEFDIHELMKHLPVESLIRFNELATHKEPSAIFAAYFELLCVSATPKAVTFFRKLLDIGKVHADKIEGDYSMWAEKQAGYLVRSHQIAFMLWVYDLCEQGEEYSADDSSVYQLILGRDWLAPRFLVMEPTPTAHEKFDKERAWERLDYKGSQNVFNRLKECFLQRVSKLVKQAAIDYRAEIATGAKPSGETEPSTAAKTSRTRKPRTGRSHQVIFGVIQAYPHLKGIEYCRQLDNAKLPVPADWKLNVKSSPKNYANAYRDRILAKRINDQKCRFHKLFRELQEKDRNSIIEGNFNSPLAYSE